jgi:uncharacterized protein (TIGR00369 family)
MSKATVALETVEEAAIRASFARQELMGTLGAWLVDVRPGSVTIELPHARKLTQQQGFFHGGVIGALADTAAGYAAHSAMPRGSEVLTIEYKINFVRPAAGTLLRAIGTVVRAGRTLVVARADVACGPADNLQTCAVAQGTFMRIDPEA